MAASDKNSLGLTLKAYEETISLAASTRVGPFYLYPRVSSMCVDVAWTSTGTPVGAFTVEVTNDDSAESGRAITATSTTSFVAQQPGGTNDVGWFVVDNIATSASRAWIVYTKSSGGTGATAKVTVNFKTAS